MKLVLPAVVGLGLLVLAGTFVWLRTGESRGARAVREVPHAGQRPDAPARLEVPARPEPRVAPEAAREEVSQGTPVDPPSRAEEAEPDERPARVRGRCVDARGQPLEGVEISGSGQLATHSAADGTFVLEMPLLDTFRSGRLEIALRGFGTRRTKAQLRAGEETDLGDILLLAAGRITGRVVDRDGVPLPKAAVRVEEVTGLHRSSPLRGPSQAGPAVETELRGTFQLEDVAPGGLRVWAGLEGWRWSVSDPLELLAGDEIQNLELVLVPLDPEDTIELVVLDPSGAPVPRARIAYRYETGNSSGSGSTTANEQGRFRQFLEVRAAYSFVASDPEERYRPAAAFEVEPGVHDLVLQLGEKRSFRLRVEDEHGAPVPRFRARVALSRMGLGSRETSHPDEANDIAPGVIEILEPPAAFELTVEAEGFELLTLGPYEPAGLPAEIVARLSALPGVRGRVLAAGKPLAGAKVSAHAALEPLGRLSVNGFACFVQHSAVSRATTDQDGAFLLTVREAKPYHVRAEAVGFAPADAGPFDFDPRLGFEGLELELGRGGAIAGRVLLLAGEDPGGRIVGASRGDGFGRTTRTDADGRYRFEGLTPGPWQVVGRDQEISPNSTSSSNSTAETPFSIPWSCEVREGQTTTFDLDLRHLQSVILSGRFRLGTQPESWVASLGSKDDPGSKAGTNLDSSGRFRLAVDAPGPYTLHLRSQQSGSFVSASTELVLHAGDNSFEADVPCGQLTGHTTQALSAERSYLFAQSSAHPGLEFSITIEPDQQGGFSIGSLPAGPATLRYSGANGEGASKAVTVPEGGTVEVVLP